MGDISCQIEFILATPVSGGDWYGQHRHEKRTVYRRFNGHPVLVIKDLLEFIRWNHIEMRDVGRTAANWIYFEKRRFEENRMEGFETAKWSDLENPLDPAAELRRGSRVCINDEYAGDISYFYRILSTMHPTAHHLPVPERITVSAYSVSWWPTREMPLTPHDFKYISMVRVPFNKTTGLSEPVFMTDEQIEQFVDQFAKKENEE